MTVKSIRGLEARSVAKWESAGWELIEQRPGRLQTELQFRRPKPKTPWRAIAIGGGALVLLFVILGVSGAFGGDDEPGASAPPTASAEAEARDEPAPTPTQYEEEAPSSASAPEPAAPPAVLTVENSPELAALLAGPTDGESVAAFAAANRGQVIEFDGAIGAMNTHDGYSTRYDILISYGDYSETQSFGGPNFQLRDVNVSDLNLTGSNVPDTIGVGDEVRIRAEVLEFEPDPGLFLLDPVETQFR
ncbi:DUF4839 domain-containing protein [Agrococcus jejuensis]|uniref:DUF4839 domain-containing protein n=1 Tax=Agrococcus jejuensis TaxID=399736 RepID=UPI00164247A6|nr:DUF4839 domain-containing protein [Agrococcus jejuensis]